MKTIKLKNKNIWIHVIVWIIVEVNYAIVNAPLAHFVSGLTMGTLLVFNAMFAFYTSNVYLFPKFFRKRNLLLIVSIIILYGIYGYLDKLIFRDLDVKLAEIFQYDPGYPFVVFPYNLMQFTIVVAYSFTLFWRKYNINKINEQNNKTKLLLEQELCFLKNQLNTHTVFNFLNYSYSFIHSKSSKLSTAIDLYSNVLRYSLLKKKIEVIELEEEIQNIKDFISLMCLIENGKYIKLEIKDVFLNWLIVPGILMKLVECYFLFGKSLSKKESFIKLKNESQYLRIELFFEINDDIKKNQVIDHINTIKGTLELFYINSYIYSYELNEFFKCNLYLKNQMRILV